MDTRAAWETPHLEAYLWFCGDDYCACTVPVVERITPNTESGYPFIRRERLWEGEFHSQSTRTEHAEQLRALWSAARRYGVRPSV